MASFWFLSAPLPGHLDWGGFLKTARVLQARGHSVRWVSEAGIQPMVEASQIRFSAIPHSGWLWPPPPAPDTSGLTETEATHLRYQRALDTWLSEDLIPPAVDAILALAADLGSPDVMVTDPFLSAAALAAEALQVPLAVAGWPASSPPDESRLLDIQRELGQVSNARIQRMADRFGLDGTNFMRGATPSVQSAHLHLSYFSRTWHQADPPFLPQTRFVGGTIQPPAGPSPAWLDAIPPDFPCALVTLGSTFTGDLNFFTTAAHATVQAGLIPMVVIGGNAIPPDQKAAFKQTLPAGTRLLNWIDYDHVFPRLAVIIHHGGMGTTHRAIVQGIPQIVVPHAADQRGQARRVAQAKVGLNLSVHEARQGQLTAAVRAVTTDARVIQAARDLASEFAALGGPPHAADLLENLAAR